MDDPQGVLARALDFGDEGDWTGMAEALREALEEAPDDPAMLCWLGVAERELGLDGASYERFKAAVAQDPEDANVLATAGAALAVFDDPDAETALRAASVMAPELSFARLMYGAYLSREGQHEQALDELTAARELAPDDAQVASELGVLAALAGRKAAAVEAFGQAVELDRDDGWARVLLGLALVEENDPERAWVELEAGARMRPEDIEAQLLAALAAAGAEYEDQAYEMLERARLNADGVDLQITLEVEERLDDGPRVAWELLVSAVAPPAYRGRLMTRP